MAGACLGCVAFSQPPRELEHRRFGQRGAQQLQADRQVVPGEADRNCQRRCSACEPITVLVGKVRHWYFSSASSLRGGGMTGTVG
jgi:hypothetical protein